MVEPDGPGPRSAPRTARRREKARARDGVRRRGKGPKLTCGDTALGQSQRAVTLAQKGRGLGALFGIRDITNTPVQASLGVARTAWSARDFEPRSRSTPFSRSREKALEGRMRAVQKARIAEAPAQRPHPSRLRRDIAGRRREKGEPPHPSSHDVNHRRTAGTVSSHPASKTMIVSGLVTCARLSSRSKRRVCGTDRRMSAPKTMPS